MTQAKNFVTHLGVNRELLGQLALERRFQVFSFLHLPAWEFPLQAVAIGAVALAYQDAVALC